MSERITVMLDDDLARRLRLMQAKQLKETNRNVSFSQVLNNVVKEGLK